MIGDDHPSTFPYKASEQVLMFRDQTVHYNLELSNTTKSEWASMMSRPLGTGRVRLGEPHRAFVITYYHQLHCLWRIERGIVDPADRDIKLEHLHHCFGYLRQLSLCKARDDLEAGDFMMADGKIEAGVMICTDWERNLDLIEENTKEWMQWQARGGTKFSSDPNMSNLL
jgi:hypothetical protein